MERVLITGKNSYIGTSVEKWLLKEPDKFKVDTLDMLNDDWQSFDFSNYDSVFHVAGIAHNSSDKKLESLYYKVNTKLTIDVARKAKDDGVKQFIFMSSIIVYGSKIPGGRITKRTKPNPDNFYGDSKLQAELGLEKLKSKNFNVAIIRPPMIYGKGSKGNFPKLVKLANFTPIFPDYDNRRSMLYIVNLNEFVRCIIELGVGGYFYPQNQEYVNTCELVRTLSNIMGRKIIATKSLNFVINFFISTSVINKIFGNLTYDYSMSEEKNFKLKLVGFKESIILTISGG